MDWGRAGKFLGVGWTIECNTGSGVILIRLSLCPVTVCCSSLIVLLISFQICDGHYELLWQHSFILMVVLEELLYKMKSEQKN